MFTPKVIKSSMTPLSVMMNHLKATSPYKDRLLLTWYIGRVWILAFVAYSIL